MQAAPAPGPDFEGVFANLSDDPAVRTHLRRTYLPALRAARGRPGLTPLHLVLRDATGPAACGSLYLRGDTAALYNVGTRADRQRRGLGTAVTIAALRAAQARGAARSSVRSSCMPGGRRPRGALCPHRLPDGLRADAAVHEPVLIGGSLRKPPRRTRRA